ncbi:hypothetical protein M0657_010498 [Pyricularia oryzae]|nr:hypothetical protein M0657_010498 [Pyricularia oryzae]KAI7927953.1 hypothetical protein M9X92_002017 [Pyricularia oryzae]
MYASQSLLLFYLDDGWLGAQNHAVLGRPWFGRGAAHYAEKTLLSYAGALRLRPGSKIVRAVGPGDSYRIHGEPKAQAYRAYLGL